MSIYEARLQADRDAITRRVEELARCVCLALSKSVEAMLSGDHDASYRVVVDDKPINRESRALDALCHEFVARHFPAAGHLRFISSVLRLDVQLERLGDYAVNLSLSAVRLSSPPSGEVASRLRDLARQSQEMLDAAVAAWVTQDAELARATRPRSKEVEAAKERFEDWLADEGGALSLRDVMIVGDLIHNLERVSAQARNLCEETRFAVSGETKPAKVYRLLFLDAGNDRLSQLAEAFARKAFPESGRYTSAGWRPAADLDAEMVDLARAVGLDLGGAVPVALEAERGQLRRHHAIITLEDGAEPHLGAVPYKTTLLNWRLDGQELSEQFKQLAAHIRELMETLRGENAN